MRICLIGPCSPNDISSFLNDFNPQDYINVNFYRGIPVSTLAINLLDCGHYVEIITSAFGIGTDSLILRGHNLQITIIRSTENTKVRALTFFRGDRIKLSNALKMSDADVYHAHWTYEFALAAIKTKGNVLVTAHDAPLKILFHYRDVYRFLRFLMAVVVRIRSRKLATVSPYLARHWRRQMLWRRNIEILPNITPGEMFEDYEINRTKFYSVLCISDSSKLKNVKTLVKAWSIVRVKVPMATLRLAGYGLGESDDLHRWALSNGLSEGIEWLGYLSRTQVASELNEARLLCHPSLEESHSLVLVESLAKGIPVIGGKKSGAVPWTLGDAGLLVNVKSEDEIAQAIIELLLDDELLVNLSKLALERGKVEFSAQKVLPSYLRAYQEMIRMR